MELKAKSKQAVLIGGCMNGRILDVDVDTEKLTVGRMFTYTYAGRTKDGRLLLAIQPQSRAQRRWLWHFIGKQGYDPRPEAFANRRMPFKYADGERPRVVGRGAAKRAARKANANV